MDEFLDLSVRYTSVLEKVVATNRSLHEIVKSVIDGRENLRKILNEDETSILQCSICVDRPKVRALNCGHCYCNSCASRILGVTTSQPRCPKCRAPVRSSIRVYIDA